MSDGFAYERIRRLYSSSVNCMRYSYLAANYGGDTKMSPLDNAMRVIENLRNINDQLTTERDELKQQLEFERIRLAACSHAALSNTDESVKDRIDNTNQYWSATYGDVCAAVDREMSLRKQLDALKAKLEGGVRVHANQYVDHDDRWLCSHYGSRKDIHNATLILDNRVEI